MISVSILNDTSRFHFGSAAVMQVIFHTLKELRWHINASFFGNSFIFENAPPILDHRILESSDVLIINGEGTIHDEARMARFLMDTIERYKHKKIVLLNCLWQNMGSKSEAQLQQARQHFSRNLKWIPLILGAKN